MRSPNATVVRRILGATGAAAVVVGVVPIVALLQSMDTIILNDAIPAKFLLAERAAAIFIEEIPVVALLSEGIVVAGDSVAAIPAAVLRDADAKAVRLLRAE